MHKMKGSLQTKKIKKYLPIPPFVFLHLRYLHQDKLVPGKVLLKGYRRYSRTSIYRQMNLPIYGMPRDQRYYKEGRPSKLSSCSKRSLIREIPKVRSKTYGKITLKDVRDSAAIPKEISNSTVSRVLYSNDYKSRPSLRKGVLTEQDCKIRLKFAKHMKKVVKETFWTEEISFCFDGAGFLHKKNPCGHSRRNKSRTWRKSDEGGNIHCTTSGRRKTAKLMVAITYEKGVTMCEEYCRQLNGASFAEFIKEYFPPCFKESGNSNLFLQDGDPSQNSRLAMDALVEVGGKSSPYLQGPLISIPSRMYSILLKED